MSITIGSILSDLAEVPVGALVRRVRDGIFGAEVEVVELPELGAEVGEVFNPDTINLVPVGTVLVSTTPFRAGHTVIRKAGDNEFLRFGRDRTYHPSGMAKQYQVLYVPAA